uniref:SID1 transmembrane family member 2 n=1 Tax=Sphenodon punctatus TaxID=8508 RepID=A0A8D0L4K7_SPHPU
MRSACWGQAVWALELALFLLLGAPGAAERLPGAPLAAKKVSEKEANFNVTYTDSVDSELLNIYTFQHTVLRNQTKGVRVSVNVLSEQKDMPVLFVVRQKEAVVSFQYFKYVFPEGLDSVIVKVTSAMAFPCSVISIQDILCPVYDLDNNVEFIGMYQTMTKKAAITVQKKDFPSNSFYVVVVVKTEDEACGGPCLAVYGLAPHLAVPPSHSVPSLSAAEAYVGGMLFCLGIFLSFYVLMLLVACWELLLHGLFCPAGHPHITPGPFLAHQPINGYGYGSFGEYQLEMGVVPMAALIWESAASCESCLPITRWQERSLENVAARPRLDSLSSVEEDDYDTLADIDSDKNVIRTKQYLYVADLARKDKRALRKKYQIYFWNIATIAVFYALPVIQLVITYQTVVNVTGNQDICYYNFLCAHPLGNLSAFNNILSNLGYILLGLLFLLIILQREINYNRALMRNDLQALVGERCASPTQSPSTHPSKRAMSPQHPPISPAGASAPPLTPCLAAPSWRDSCNPTHFGERERDPTGPLGLTAPWSGLWDPGSPTLSHCLLPELGIVANKLGLALLPFRQWGGLNMPTFTYANQSWLFQAQ